MRKLASVSVIIAALILPALGQTADKTPPPLGVRFLFQPQIQVTGNDSPDKTSAGKDAFLRRARIIVSGAITDRITLFADTDIPNFGKGGNWSGSMYLQDAYLDVLLLKDKGFLNSLHLAAGLILLPFAHNDRQSAATLNTLDYHSADILFPNNSTKVWRDTGLEARGLFWGSHLDVRLGVFRGLRGNPADAHPVNPDDNPRWTGRVQVNFLDAEDAFFYGGTYFGAKKILSVGGGLDNMTRYHAATLDGFLDYPLSADTEAVAQAAYFHYHPEAGVPTLDAASGDGFDLEAGFRYKHLEPVLSYEDFNPDVLALRPADFARNWRFGLNWWIKGHTVNLKSEYARLTTKDALGAASTRGQLTVQAQVFY